MAEPKHVWWLQALWQMAAVIGCHMGASGWTWGRETSLGGWCCRTGCPKGWTDLCVWRCSRRGWMKPRMTCCSGGVSLTSWEVGLETTRVQSPFWGFYELEQVPYFLLLNYFPLVLWTQTDWMTRTLFDEKMLRLSHLFLFKGRRGKALQNSWQPACKATPQSGLPDLNSHCVAELSDQLLQLANFSQKCHPRSWKVSLETARFRKKFASVNQQFLQRKLCWKMSCQLRFHVGLS